MGFQLLADLLLYAEIKPVCNQIELHPLNTQDELIRYLKDQNILPVAYCPIVRPTGGRDAEGQDLVKNELILSLADKYKKSPVQVMLRYGIERGYSVIPKSADPGRQKENLNVFDFNLSQEEVEKINGLNKNYRICNKFDFLNKGYDMFC